MAHPVCSKVFLPFSLPFSTHSLPPTPLSYPSSPHLQTHQLSALKLYIRFNATREKVAAAESETPLAVPDSFRKRVAWVKGRRLCAVMTTVVGVYWLYMAVCSVVSVRGHGCSLYDPW